MNESDDYLWDKSGPPDPDVKRLEDLLGGLRHDPQRAPLDELRLRRGKPSRRTAWIIGGLVATAAVAMVVWWRWPGGAACSGGVGFAFTGEGGAVACGGAPVAKGVLPVGGTLDTGTHTAKLAIATIGTAELGPGTRVRLDATSSAGHNLHLERGSLHAKVSAPPRLFAITTPSTAVTDLGCEYAIEVDARGAGAIRVISGKVELQATAGMIIVAPAGTHAAILPGNRPGLPLVTAASAALEAAVADYQRGVPGALARVLAAATDVDAITLVNLAMLEPGNVDVVRRLGALAPSEAWSVDVVATDPLALARWRDEIVSTQIAIDGLLDR